MAGEERARTNLRFCNWCKDLTIIAGQQREDDILLLYLHGQEVRAFWNGKSLIVPDGICERCRKEKFPETVRKESSDAIPPS